MSKEKIDKWAIPHVKNYRTYLDIGANIGTTSEPYVSKFKEVHSFEPNPECIKELKKIDGIILHECAIGEQTSTVELIQNGDTGESGHGTVSKERASRWNNQGEVYVVEMKTIDSFDFKDVDFIKIDVEQYEYYVVLGAINTIKKYHPVIMFENKRKENDKLIPMLKEIGYTVEKRKSDTIAYYGA